MNYTRIVLINISITIGLFFMIIISSYLISIKRINDFFELTTPDHVAYLQKDSLAMFIHKPSIYIYDNWGTPQQKISTKRRTNNLGFREDTDIIEKKENEIRVLVTGDSHTDGVLKHNYQSFVNIWEEKQNQIDSSYNFNFINGGTAYYTFRNYLGFLKKYKYLNPDIYLINIFTGNDFREAPMFEDDRTKFSNVSKNFYVRTRKLFYSKKKKSIPFTQGLEQILYFKSFPSEQEKSLKLAKKYLLEIKEICQKENIKLIVTLLPSKIETNNAFRNKLQSLFDLDSETIMINEKLTNNLIQWLDSEKIININFKDLLKNASEKIFWDVDLHINPYAHKIIAHHLLDNEKVTFR
jgi:hypothetical protein